MDAIVVNWNGRRYLPRCLEALRAQTVATAVTVVDNASTDGSAESIRTHHPDVRLIALGENRGYAGGANIGLRATSGEYAMVLNPMSCSRRITFRRSRNAWTPSLRSARRRASCTR